MARILALSVVVVAAARHPASADCNPAKSNHSLYAVKIASTPPGATIYINDKQCKLGVTPWEGKLNAAEYKVIVEADGYDPAEQLLKVTRQRTTQELVLALHATAPVATPDVPPPPPPPPPPQNEDTPWSKGVSDAQKQTAQALLEEGNALFVKNQHVEALAKYQAALKSWDHPAIRFNMVRALIALERPLEAYDNLEKALEYGKGPLDDVPYNEALNYRRLLANQVGEIEVSCMQRGVTVTLDGKSLLACPASKKLKIAPGQHQVVGTAEGFAPRSSAVVVLGGKHERVAVTLEPLTGRVVHRWSTWLPWGVIAGGAVVAGIGELVNLKAITDNNRYLDSVNQYCAPRCGLDDPRLDHSAQRLAGIESKISIGAFALAGAALVAGGTMLYLNRGRIVFDSGEHHPATAHLDVTPIPGGLALGAQGQF